MSDKKDVIVPVPPEIREFAKTRGIPITQLNGQRFYGPSFYLSGACQQEQPVDLTEVYVGRIPKYLLEPDLVPFLEGAAGGPFYQLRLMMEFNGDNRGYCFVTYFDHQQAAAAIAYLNCREFPKDSRNQLVAHRSINNKRLILGGIPSYKNLPEIYQEVNHYYPGVTFVHKTRFNNPGAIKCLIFVDYQDHRTAIKARSKMLSEKCHLWGFKITVDWAKPEGDQLPHTRKKGTEALQVENVSYRTTITQLKALFNQDSLNGVQRISRMGKRAIIYFATRDQAEAARLMTKEVIIDENQIYVDWCHPFVLELDIQRRKEVRRRRNKNRRYRCQLEKRWTPTNGNEAESQTFCDIKLGNPGVNNLQWGAYQNEESATQQPQFPTDTLKIEPETPMRFARPSAYFNNNGSLPVQQIQRDGHLDNYGYNNYYNCDKLM